MTHAPRLFLKRILNWMGLGFVRGLLLSVAGLTLAMAHGCEVNSFFDPSRTGRFQYEPTTIPILERIDVIEQRTTQWAEPTAPSSDDLLPNELAYRITPSDSITVSIFELVQTGQWSTSTRRVDPSGNLRVQEVGDVEAAGLSAQELEDRIAAVLVERFMAHPQVDVVIEQAGGLRYSINGFVQNWGLFNLQNPDLRLVEALSLAGGVPMSTERIFIIRRVVLSEEVKPFYERRDSQPTPTTHPSVNRPTANIEDLINQLEKDGRKTPPAQPGMFHQQGEPPVDIDDLEPVRVGTTPPPVDVDSLNRQNQTTQPGSEDSFIYVPERGEWVRVHKQPAAPKGTPPSTEQPQTPETQMILQRVIQIDYDRLVHGDQSQNIVIRPGDNIFVDGPPRGLVYIDGEIARPGVYNLPDTDILTLSRLVASAGGLGGIAIPGRVDLTRMVGPLREATIRLDLAAIRQRTEPDVVMKPNDHVIIGTNFIAWPLAVIRNGFRATYGYGFILDRNFGYDVFGPQNNNQGF